MKKALIVLFLILTLSAGCATNSSPDKEAAKPQIQGNYAFENVTINTYYQVPPSLKDKNTVILNGLADREFIEVIVAGGIKDFRHVELVWDDQRNVTTEKRVINKLDTVTDKTIIIKTVMPEGIPSEKIEWKTMSGKAYEFVIENDGVGND